MIALIIFLTFGSVISQNLQKDSSVCSLPLKTGACKAFFTAFYYNSESGVCDCFIYGGCGSNGNKFDSLEECLSTCGNNNQPPIITSNCRQLFSHLYGSIATTSQPFPFYEYEFDGNSLDQPQSISNKFSFDVDSGIIENGQNSAFSNSRIPPIVFNSRPPPVVSSTRPPPVVSSTRPPSVVSNTRPPTVVSNIRTQSVVSNSRTPPIASNSKPPSAVSNSRPPTTNSRLSLAAMIQRRQLEVLHDIVRRQREFELFHQKKNEEELLRQQNLLQSQTDSLRGSG